MKESIIKTMVPAARLCGLIALGSGTLSWAGYTVPLYIHIAAGGLLVIAVWVLAFQARLLATGLALFAVVAGAGIPVVGLLQLRFQLGDFQWMLQWLHFAAGLGGIGLAEILAKRIRLSVQTL
jgi:hypothetical protein